MKIQLAIGTWFLLMGLLLLGIARVNWKKNGEEIVVAICLAVGLTFLAVASGLLL